MGDSEIQRRESLEAGGGGGDAVTESAGLSDHSASWRAPKPLWVAVLAAVIVVAVGGLTLLFRGEDAFSFAEDDLCGLLTDDEVETIVREAYAAVGIDWDGTVQAVAPSGSAWDLPGQEYCRWDPTGGDYVIARHLASSQFDLPDAFSELDPGEGIAFRTVYGHPDLDEDVIAGGAAFGRYGFWMQGSDDVLGLEAVLRNGADTIDWAEQEKMLVHIAGDFLDRMGWTTG